MTPTVKINLLDVDTPPAYRWTLSTTLLIVLLVAVNLFLFGYGSYLRNQQNRALTSTAVNIHLPFT